MSDQELPPRIESGAKVSDDLAPPQPPASVAYDPPQVAANPFADRTDEQPAAAAFQSPATRRVPWIVAGLLLGLFALVNVTSAPFAENMSGPPDGWVAVAFAVGLGLIGGQIGALSGALVWSRGIFFIRLALLWLIGATLFGCWYAGHYVAIGPDWHTPWRYEIERAIACSLPLISLAVQIPQWMARFYFGWRVESPESVAVASPQYLSIRDLFTGTVIAALTVTAVRFSQDAEHLTTEVWIAWAIAVGILAVISALVTLPLLVLILRGHHALWALLFIAIGSPLLAGATIYTIMQVDGVDGGPDTRAIVIFLLAATACVATTSAPLWLARLGEYRLKMGRE